MPAREFRNILLLQGGGALGAYHHGVFESLVEAGIEPDWVAGVSIGALNAALIAGNRPGKRLEVMEAFWNSVSGWFVPVGLAPLSGLSGLFPGALTVWSALSGIPGVFRPWWATPPFLHSSQTAAAVSVYDTTPLRETLERLVDFDLLNDGPIRVSVGAVGVTTGKMRFFDNRSGPDQTRITVDHILASGALPPGFPPVEIDDEWYWDGGVASNSSLQYVLDARVGCDANIFQVDLFSDRGAFPRTMIDAYQRAEEIRFASRTQLATDEKRSLSKARRAVRKLLAHCAPELDKLEWEERVALEAFACEPRVVIGQIVYRGKNGGARVRMADTSPSSIARHRSCGRRDAAALLALHDWSAPPRHQGVQVIDPGAPVYA